MGIYRLVICVVMVGCGKVNSDTPDAAIVVHCDATFTVSAGPVLGALVTFTAADTESTSYAWTFDADATPAASTTKVATAAFMTTGAHTVMLTVMNFRSRDSITTGGSTFASAYPRVL